MADTLKGRRDGIPVARKVINTGASAREGRRKPARPWLMALPVLSDSGLPSWV